jgi:phosphoribosylglycinamide formyltransferase-1
MRRIAVLASGRGSNFEAIARNIREGRLDAGIAALVVNNPEARALDIAREYGIHAISMPSKGIGSDAYAAMVRDALAPLRVDLICLAGFMRRVGAPLLEAYPMRILNIHPSLLPAFPGLNVQQQAIDYGVKVSGCTVHFVDAELDTGPIVAQAAVPVLDDDTAETLAARILQEEHRIYSEAIALVLSGEYRIEGRRVIRVPSSAGGGAEPAAGRCMTS